LVVLFDAACALATGMYHPFKNSAFIVKLISYYLFFVLFSLSAGTLAQQVSGTDNQPVKSPGGVKYTLQLSPYALHWAPRDPEDRDVFLIGVEREHANGKIDGAAFFSNTFGQESLYLFPWGGVYKNIYGVSKLSFKWSAGLIYGYKAPFEKKIPLNYKGFAPAIIPALTYEFSPRWSGQLNLLGTQGVMFQLNVPLN
jgi:hypothetical protein